MKGDRDALSSSPNPATYRILREIARGGMGVVYQAEDPDGRRFAIKVARYSLLRQSWKRFRNEHRILAGLEHPAIAKVLDAGKTDDGRPYFVMEYIDGEPIHRYCDDRELHLAARLKLFLKVASAVEAAHEKGIVHRDIKPSNILVTADGEPKLLDFGIAKLLDPDEYPFTTPATVTGEWLLSPPYASPEQIRGHEITHLSDVYSLGALLYQLLTGRLPYQPVRFTLSSMERAMAQGEPPKPSDLVGRSPLRSGPRTRRLRAQLTGALDRVVLMALRQDPEARYPSVGELAADLRRYLAGREVAARDAPFAYRVSRYFVRRPWLRPLLLPAIVLLGIAVTYTLGRLPSAGLATPGNEARQEIERIVVGDLENATGEPRLDDSLTMAFHVGLAQSRHLEVLSRHQVTFAADRLDRDSRAGVDREALVEIGRQEGARGVLWGRVSRDGAGYQVAVELVDPGTGEVDLGVTQTAGSEQELLPALDAIVSRLRHHLGESPLGIEARPLLVHVMSPNLEALQAYSEGVELYRRKHWPAAGRALERAIELDPGFAMAHAKLGVVHQNLDLSTAGRHFQTALDHTDRLTVFQGLYVTGAIATREGSTEDMLGAWQSLSQLFPESPLGYSHLALIHLIFTHRYDEAAAAVDQYVQLEGNRAYDLRAEIHLVRDELARCESVLGKTDEVFQNWDYQNGMVKLALAREDRTWARSLIEEYRAKDGSAELWQLDLLMLADQGSLREMLVTLDRIVPTVEAPHLRLGAQALGAGLAVRLGDDDRRRRMREVLTDAPPILAERRRGRNFLPVPDLALLGKLLARFGDLDEAREIAELIRPLHEQRNLSLWTAYELLLEGEILAAEGQLDAAVDRLSGSLETLESVQVHESLAHLHEARGDTAAATSEHIWLVEHPGRALTENVGFPSLFLHSVIDLGYSSWHLGRLYDAAGDGGRARWHTQRFVERWGAGDRPPEWLEASERLAEPNGEGEAP